MPGLKIKYGCIAAAELLKQYSFLMVHGWRGAAGRKASYASLHSTSNVGDTKNTYYASSCTELNANRGDDDKF